MLTLTKSAAKGSRGPFGQSRRSFHFEFFFPIDLAFPEENVIIENVHLSDFLMILSYQLEN